MRVYKYPIEATLNSGAVIIKNIAAGRFIKIISAPHYPLHNNIAEQLVPSVVEYPYPVRMYLDSKSNDMLVPMQGQIYDTRGIADIIFEHDLPIYEFNANPQDWSSVIDEHPLISPFFGDFIALIFDDRSSKIHNQFDEEAYLLERYFVGKISENCEIGGIIGGNWHFGKPYAPHLLGFAYINFNVIRVELSIKIGLAEDGFRYKSTDYTVAYLNELAQAQGYDNYVDAFANSPLWELPVLQILFGSSGYYGHDNFKCLTRLSNEANQATITLTKTLSKDYGSIRGRGLYEHPLNHVPRGINEEDTGTAFDRRPYPLHVNVGNSSSQAFDCAHMPRLPLWVECIRSCKIVDPPRMDPNSGAPNIAIPVYLDGIKIYGRKR